ncbi:MAG TPA: hypothetical protein VLM75_14130 [Spirochaetota bacterium]|nr:hypothetical protein [Spirochaetota bacterium]
MKKTSGFPVFLFTVIFFTGMFARSASALSFGIYGQYKTASAELNSDYLDPDPMLLGWEEDADAERSLFGFGLLIDTAVAKDKLFNYRLQLGIATGSLSIDGTQYSKSIGLTEYHMYHSFGFGLVRTDSMRLWLGPQLGLGNARGSYSYAGKLGMKYIETFASIGAILGLNAHLSERISLGLSTGARNNFVEVNYSTDNDLHFNYKGSNGGLEMFGDVALILRYE